MQEANNIETKQPEAVSVENTAKPAETKVESVTPSAPEQKTVKKSNIGTFILVFILLIVALIGGLVGGYLLWGQDKIDLQSIFTNKKSDEQKSDDADDNVQKKDQKEDSEDDSDDKDKDNEESEDEDTDNEQESDSQQFTGDAISAVLPNDWQIVEYFDGQGTDMLVSNVSYDGLSAIEVINPDNEVIFKLKGVYGIGGTDYCSNYYQFEDFDQADYDYFNGVSEEFYGEELPIIDLSAESYSEINLLDRELRRIDKKLYIDTKDNNATFDAGCGIYENMWEIESLTLMQDTHEGHTYTWSISNTVTDEELEILDDILNSFSAI